MRHLCVEASAGSGKTFGLAVRFLAIFLSGEKAEEMLALTFTEKATGEMKERIVSTFLNLHLPEKKDYLSEISKALNLSSQEILKRRDARKDEFLQANLRVQTIDAFCSSVVRKFSLHLGLMPNFENGSNIDAASTELFLERILSSEFAAEFVRFVKEFENSQTSAINMLFELSGLDTANLNLPYSTPASRFPTKDEVASAANELQNYFEELASGVKVKNETNLRKALAKRDPNEVLLSTEKNYFTQNSWLLTPLFYAKLEALKEATKRYFLDVESYKISNLLKFTTLYKEARKETISKNEKCDFCDVSALAHDLLKNGNLKEQLYFRLDAKITHILLDEFQDTNLTQYEILHPLIAESVAGRGTNEKSGTFYYVGDKKQSIYRFRGGQQEIFDRVRADFLQVEKDVLNTNYRSCEQIVKFANETFGKFEWYEKQEHKKEGGYVKVCGVELPGKDEEVENKNEVIYDEVLTQIRFLCENGVFLDDIAVLCWKNDTLGELKTHLTKNGIAVASEDNKNITYAHEVGLVLDLLKFSLFGDKIFERSLREYLPSFWTNSKSSEEETVELVAEFVPFKLEKLDISSPARCVFVAARALGLDVMSPNLLSFYEIAQGKANVFELFEALPELEKPMVSVETSGVKLMTIHKSKGLEFQSVIVLDKFTRNQSGGERFLKELSGDAKSVFLRQKEERLAELDERYGEVEALKEARDRQEKLNVLYVALTRAKANLVVVKNKGKNGYFTPYKSNGELVEFLDVREGETGEVVKSESAVASVAGGESEVAPFEKVARQTVVEREEEEWKNVNDDGAGAVFGEAVHYCLEMCGDFDEEKFWAAKEMTRNKFGAVLSEGELAGVFERAEFVLCNEEFLALVRGGVEVLHEFSVIDEGVLLRMDAVVVAKDAVVVVDFKTGREVAEHKKQVERYKKALGGIFSDVCVRGLLVYVGEKGVRLVWA